MLDEVFVISWIIKVEVRVISQSRSLRAEADNSYRTLILDITKTESNNCFIINRKKKNGSHIFASPLTASITKRANLAWLPLEIMHRGHIINRCLLIRETSTPQGSNSLLYMDYCECVYKKTRRTRQEATQLKLRISLKLGTNDGICFPSKSFKEGSQVLLCVEYLLLIK